MSEAQATFSRFNRLFDKETQLQDDAAALTSSTADQPETQSVWRLTQAARASAGEDGKVQEECRADLAVWLACRG